MLLLEGYISNFKCAGYYFLYVEFSDFYVNQSLAGHTIQISKESSMIFLKQCVQKMLKKTLLTLY
jgi:hypothetical protein